MNDDMTKISFNIDKIDKKKLEYISELEYRTLTGQLKNVLKKFVNNYEKENDLENDKKYQSLNEDQ